MQFAANVIVGSLTNITTLSIRTAFLKMIFDIIWHNSTIIFLRSLRNGFRINRNSAWVPQLQLRSPSLEYVICKCFPRDEETYTDVDWDWTYCKWLLWRWSIKFRIRFERWRMEAKFLRSKLNLKIVSLQPLDWNSNSLSNSVDRVDKNYYTRNDWW